MDLIGKITSEAEAPEYLNDTGPDKRQRLVDDLLDRGAHAAHFANVWREMLLANANAEARALAPQLEAWLRLRFSANAPYDQLVRELLTASSRGRQQQMAVGGGPPSPLAFYDANERKPELLAASTSRIFLGVQVQCAQCHNHPFAHWSRQEFWSLAAFFTSLEGAGQATYGPLEDKPDHDGVQIPEIGTLVEPRFLDGSQPDWQQTPTKRVALARWMTRADNPYFARAAVNRLIDHFLGRGFVTPVDDLDPANPPSHPELFEEITRQFALHKYDLNYLIRAITATQAYQLSSRSGASADDDLQHFARMPLRRMTADQLFDSLVEATGFREPRQQRQVAALDTGSVRGEFLNKFATQSVPRTEAETSILQALSLMNGKFTADVTDLESSETLLAVVEAPFLDTPARIETLYLATLSRKPDEREQATMQDYLAKHEAQDQKRAYADIFWALLNSAEFNLNH